MRLIVLNDALCPQIRAPLWLKHKRELSLLKLVRHFPALAARWMQAIFQSELELRRFLQRACAAAERLVAKAARKRQPTAQRLHEDLRQPLASIVFAVAVNANATRQARWAVGARHERTLAAVAWTPWLGLYCRPTQYAGMRRLWATARIRRLSEARSR